VFFAENLFGFQINVVAFAVRFATNRTSHASPVNVGFFVKNHGEIGDFDDFVANSADFEMASVTRPAVDIGLIVDKTTAFFNSLVTILASHMTGGMANVGNLAFIGL
jgi:hypothetical protein